MNSKEAVAKPLPFTSILVYGLGMMSTSLLLAIREKYTNIRIDGVIRDDSKQAFFRELKLLDNLYIIPELKQAASLDIKPYDLIIIGLLPQQSMQLLSLSTWSHFKGLITDLSSAHNHIFTVAKKNRVPFIGSHPMCGTEHSGPQAYKHKLYAQKLCFLIYKEDETQTSSESLNKLFNFWQCLEMEPHIIEPERHDKLLAELSHLPYLLANTLANYSYKTEEFQKILKEQPHLNNISGGGLKDMIRTAGSNPDMWLDIIQLNRRQNIQTLKSFQSSLNKLIELLEHNKTEDLLHFLKNAKKSKDYFYQQ